MGIVGFVGIGAGPGAIRVAGVTKTYPDGTEALKDVFLDIRPGERLGLVGPSGAGKTTLLSIIAGDEQASAGEVTVDGKAPREFPPPEREGPVQAVTTFAGSLGFKVYEYLAEALDSRNVERREIDRAIWSAARALGIEELMDHHLRTLSHTEREMVQAAKAVVTPARAYLVDGLDPVRVADLGQVTGEQRPPTVVYATTEPQEAVRLDGRIAVMFQGTVEQVGDAHAVLDDPRTLNVARIVAPGNAAFVEGTVVHGNLRLAGDEFTFPHLRPALRPYQDRPVVFRLVDDRLDSGPQPVRSYAAAATSPALRAVLQEYRSPAGAASLPFSPVPILAFDPATGERISAGGPEVITVRPVPSVPPAPAAASAGEVPVTRAVNAWLIGTSPPIPVGKQVRVGFNIGPVVREALAAVPFAEPHWGGRKTIECNVLLLSDECDVSPPGQKLRVPRLGASRSLEFRIQARADGPVTLRFQIYLTTGSLLIQELNTQVEAAVKEAEVSV